MRRSLISISYYWHRQRNPDDTCTKIDFGHYLIAKLLLL
ncbi:Hypothetical protein ETEE_3943 [Edwardsiella anguillarum ET080813]|uniref:Uncharacterized protein n=1 Tax=Edwardsiella anguillarum ET080813 TaxID=667120 RepID=A0A076LUJ1_9GAMM|nr:Hypothetical protein ETEE_3943 [Edwardsiella anguillarum ET080813]